MAPGENCCVVPVFYWKDFFYSTRKNTGNKFLPARLKIRKIKRYPRPIIVSKNQTSNITEIPVPAVLFFYITKTNLQETL